MKEERREIAETRRKAKPSEVGGFRSKMMGITEAEERMKRMKLRKESRRFGNEHEFLSFEEEPIFFVSN